MIEIITRNLEEIRAACVTYDVDKLWVFGSAVRDDWVEGKSDVDFIPSFGESDRSLFRQHMGLIVSLQDVLGVPVDVVDERSISKAPFKAEVERTKVLIYEQSFKTVPA